VAVIYHIAEGEAWRSTWADGASASAGAYVADSLATEGFIHCSTPAQVLAVAESFYGGRKGLILLTIDTSRVQAEIRHENLEGGAELYPHLYGPLNLDAVVSAVPFEPDAKGGFELPTPVQEPPERD